MNFADTVEAGLKQIEKAMGNQTFVWDEDEYICHVGQQTATTVLETGGFDETLQTVLVVRKSVFTDDIYPKEDEKVTYNSIVYYIASVNTDASNTFLNIALK